MKVIDPAAQKNTISKDKVREFLHTLQPSATDKENLVAAGRMLRSDKQTRKTNTKNVIPEKTKSSPPNKSKKFVFEDKAIQVAQEEKTKITVEDLVSRAGPSENYWKVLSEKRQIAIENASKKIKTLEEQLKKLKKENKRLKEEKLIQEEMLKETRALVEVLQEMIDND